MQLSATSRNNFVQQRRRQGPGNYNTNTTGNKPQQNQPAVSSAPVTLTMTTAATDSRINRQLSADQITRNAEEEKLQQLKNVNLVRY